MELKTDSNCHLRNEYITVSYNFIAAKLKILYEHFSNSNNYDCDDILIQEIEKLIDFAGEKAEVCNKMRIDAKNYIKLNEELQNLYKLKNFKDI